MNYWLAAYLCGGFVFSLFIWLIDVNADENRPLPLFKQVCALLMAIAIWPVVLGYLIHGKRL